MKFKIGDKVRIVNYGHLIVYEEGFIDMSPNEVGQIGIVNDISENGKYRLSKQQGKLAWFDEKQLELC